MKLQNTELRYLRLHRCFFVDGNKPFKLVLIFFFSAVRSPTAKKLLFVWHLQLLQVTYRRLLVVVPGIPVCVYHIIQKCVPVRKTSLPFLYFASFLFFVLPTSPHSSELAEKIGNQAAHTAAPVGIMFWSFISISSCPPGGDLRNPGANIVVAQSCVIFVSCFFSLSAIPPYPPWCAVRYTEYILIIEVRGTFRRGRFLNDGAP